MKILEFLNKLEEPQRNTVMKAYQSTGMLDLDLEVDASVDKDTLEFLKALSNPIRFQILKLLSKGWLCVCLISSILEKDQTLISHHLRTLKEAGLVEKKRIGKMHFYRLNKEAVQKHLERVGEILLGG
ncbi:MAG: hypothetical protein PWQ95_781 [Thermococcaceae archaeon]|nr:hypothetical protein [Thermococcaceae archaeon]